MVGRGLVFIVFLGWGVVLLAGHESDYRRKSTVDLVEVGDVAPVDRDGLVSRWR